MIFELWAAAKVEAAGAVAEMRFLGQAARINVACDDLTSDIGSGGAAEERKQRFHPAVGQS